MLSSNIKQMLQSTEMDDNDDTYLSAWSLCFNRIFSAILNAAIDLDLFDIIKAQSLGGSISLSASEIASHLPNHQHLQLANRLERILPVLASNSLLNCSIRTNEDGKKERVYVLSPTGQYFARDNHGGSLGPLSSLIHRGYHDVWEDVKDAIVDPNNNNHFQNLHGMVVYEYMEINKELGNNFNKAMAQIGPLEMKRILKLYKGFEGVSTLVDVGGGQGHTLNWIISEYPSIKGINFDLPQVVQDAPPYPGIEHIGGDMFESVPKGDAILLKFICHNWSDEECVKFLKNCYNALPQHGKVIILDFIIPEIPNSSSKSRLNHVADCLMFLVHGGKERTDYEFQSLGSKSGFSKFHVAYNDFLAISGVLEFYK